MPDQAAPEIATEMPDFAAEEAAIKACVRGFYDLARTDDVLGPVFNKVIRDWDGHLKTMDDFWSGALLGTKRYSAAPFPPHVKLDMNQDHFDRWRDLWVPCAEKYLPEPMRSKAMSIGEHMAHCWGRAYTTIKGQMEKV
jgi:hemoglobin